MNFFFLKIDSIYPKEIYAPITDPAIEAKPAVMIVKISELVK